MLELKYSVERFNEIKMYGLGNSIYNYLMTNKIFENKFNWVQIEKQEVLCSLADEKINNYIVDNIGVYRVLMYKDNILISTKFCTLLKLSDFLRNLNTIISEVETIKISKIEDAEIL